jgi:pimeloyl-ACP methyl ester carboxylesterase
MRRRIKDSIQKITIKGKSRHDPAGIDNTARAASSSTSRGNTTVAFPVGPSTWVECEDADVDICFVHGLTGNRDTTWTAKGEIEPWPKTLLPTEFPNCRARIMTYGYDAYIVRWGAASSNQLIDHAITFLQKISADREKARGTARPLIIVAHSLGGLVTKQAILQSKNSPEPHLQNLFKMTKGIIFMGTPHAGSWMADWFKIPIDIFGILKSNNTSLLRVLQTNDELLRSLNKDFLSLLRVLREGDGQKIHVTCFYEELGYPKVGHIVSRSSATFASDTPISIHANHSEMVKFRSVSDDGFQSVAGELRRWMEDFR